MRVDVQTGGSSRGIADARQGLADHRYGVARPARLEESDLEEHRHRSRRYLLDRPPRQSGRPSLSEDQVAELCSPARHPPMERGRRPANEADHGRATRREGRSTLELFLAHFNLDSPADQVRRSIVIGDNEQGIKTVAGQVRTRSVMCRSAPPSMAQSRTVCRSSLLPMGDGRRDHATESATGSVSPCPGH